MNINELNLEGLPIIFVQLLTSYLFLKMILPKITVQKIETLAGHQDCVYSLEKFKEKHLFLSCAGDGKIALWNLKNPELGHLIAQIPSSVYAMRYFEKENALIIGQNFEGLQMIFFDENNIPDKTKNKSLRITNSQIFDIQIIANQEDNKNNNQENTLVFVAQGDGVLTIVDLVSFSVKKHLKISNKSLRKIAINSQKNEFAVASSDNFIRIFDLQTLQLKQEIEAHTNSVFSLRYFSDNQVDNQNDNQNNSQNNSQNDNDYLISGSRDAHLKIWQKNNQNLHKNHSYELKTDIIAHLFAINDIDFSPCRNYFATCSMDKTIKVWDSKTFSLLKVIDKARNASHATSINKILWTDYQTDSQNYLISASDDKFISVWGINFE